MAWFQRGRKPAAVEVGRTEPASAGAALGSSAGPKEAAQQRALPPRNPLPARSGEVQRSQRKTHRYGSGGSPLCQWCLAQVQAKWGAAVRYVSTRL